MTLTVDAPPRRVAGTGTAPRSRRLAAAVLGDLAVLALSLLAASIVIFGLLAVLPGDQAAIIGGMDATPEQLDALRTQLGLDRPLPVRYLDWMGGILRGDLGSSALDGGAVAAELAQKLQVTVPLGLLALLLSVVIAVPVGTIAAVARDSAFGRALTAASQIASAVPAFVLGLLLVVVVALPTRLFPVQGFPASGWAEPAEALRSLALPALAVAIGQAAVLIRFVRSAMIDVLAQDWVRIALAQGWSLPAVLRRQGLRNAALPLVGVLGLEIAGVLMGSVIVEQLFALPGVGGMLLSDVGNRDIVSLQNTLFVLTAIVMATTMLLGLAARLLDPRLRGAR